jgi:hypothetical protein
MIDASRLGEAHEPRLGELGEFACHFVLAIPVWWERHRRAGDVRSAARETSDRLRGCEIRCIERDLTTNNVPSRVPELVDCVRSDTPRTATLCPTTTTAARADGAAGSASRDSVADSTAIRLHYGEGRIDLGWSSPLRLAPRLISARRSCHPKQ